MQNSNRELMVMKNGGHLPVQDIPNFSLEVFQESILNRVSAGWRVVALFGMQGSKADTTILFLIMADDRENLLHAAQTRVIGSSYPSLTPLCPQVHLFEREIAEQFGLIPVGHPWLKPVRFHASWTNHDAWERGKDQPIIPGSGDFFRVEGDQVHEVSVGPVHAGIIEPGHFRFQCHGEQVFHLEIALGYQHRGIEQALCGGPNNRSLHFAETVSGDSTIAHCLSYSQISESLSNSSIGARSQTVRGIALELERLANHIGDLGGLAGDVGFLPTASYCGRIRGDFLNMTALLCGNRFGRGLVVPGGIGFDLDESKRETLLSALAISEKEATSAVNLLWETQSVMARFENIGILTPATIEELGIVGPSARASGVGRDVRFDQPSGIYRFAQIPVSTCVSGDVFARAFVRWLEFQQSITFIRDQLTTLPAGNIRQQSPAFASNTLAVVLNEGWRGEVCHAAITDENGKFLRYKIIDPSFHNWIGLAIAMRNQEISDFPICNKSFSLSYCGFDL